MNKLHLWVLTACAVLTLSACSSGPSYTKADTSLQEASSGSFDVVLLPPSRTLPAFSRVYIENPEVTMNRYWLTSFRSQYNNADLERIDRDYGRLLKASLSKGVSENTTLTVVDSAEDADVIFRPRLLNLNIYAPDLMQPGRRAYYSQEVGNATLDLHLIDASSGEVIAQFVDHRETSTGIMMRGERANRATNARYFRRLMDRWSDNLADYLIDSGATREPE